MRGFVSASHGGGNAATRREGPNYLQSSWSASGHKVVHQAIGHVLVKNALVAKLLQIKLQRLQFDAELLGRVLASNCSEVRLAGLGAYRRELWAHDFNDVIAAGVLVRKRFKLV